MREDAYVISLAVAGMISEDGVRVGVGEGVK